MRHFAQNPEDRAGSPYQKRPGSVNRQRVAANAKVQVQRTVLSHGQPAQQQQHLSVRDASNKQQSHEPRNQPGAHIKQDLYDTDAESIDTTQGPGSFLVKNENENLANFRRQSPQQQQNRARDNDHASEEHDEYGSDNFAGIEEGFSRSDEFEFDEEEQNMILSRGFQDASDEDKVRLLHQLGVREHINHNDRYGGDESYPPTTSGNPTEISNAQNGRLSPEVNVDRVGVPQAPQPRAAAHATHRLRLASDGLDAILPGPAINGRSMFQQGAAIREQHKAKVRVNRGPALFGIPSSEPPRYSQVSDPTAVAPPENPREHIAIPMQTPMSPRDVSVADRPPRIVERLSLISSTSDSNPESEASPAIQRPIIDYDEPDLFNMKYEQLKNENFDLDPRAPATVLPEDMRQKTLAERLEYARKQLESSDQATFCQRLPTAEWEDAGDWFLEQFTDIVKRTKEARRSKRKLAEEFENAVEQRHKHVEKKRGEVEHALSEMQRQGQGLIRSPRRSKSPR